MVDQALWVEMMAGLRGDDGPDVAAACWLTSFRATLGDGGAGPDVEYGFGSVGGGARALLVMVKSWLGEDGFRESECVPVCSGKPGALSVLERRLSRWLAELGVGVVVERLGVWLGREGWLMVEGPLFQRGPVDGLVVARPQKTAAATSALDFDRWAMDKPVEAVRDGQASVVGVQLLSVLEARQTSGEEVEDVSVHYRFGFSAGDDGLWSVNAIKLWSGGSERVPLAVYGSDAVNQASRLVEELERLRSEGGLRLAVQVALNLATVNGLVPADGGALFRSGPADLFTARSGVEYGFEGRQANKVFQLRAVKRWHVGQEQGEQGVVIGEYSSQEQLDVAAGILRAVGEGSGVGDMLTLAAEIAESGGFVDPVRASLGLFSLGPKDDRVTGVGAEPKTIVRDTDSTRDRLRAAALK